MPANQFVNHSSESEFLAEAWQSLRMGSRQALSNIFYICYEPLFHYGLRLCREEEEVKDTIQQLFTRLWQQKNSLSIVGNVKPYLLSSLRNDLLRRINKTAHFQTCTLESGTHIMTLIHLQDEEDEWQLVQQQLQQVLRTLPDNQQEIIYLRFYNGLSMQEIASIMGLQYQSARNSLYRALKKLRLEMDRLRTAS